MSHIKTIDFADASVASGHPTTMVIHYQSDDDGEPIALHVLVAGVSIKPRSVKTRRGTRKDAFQVTLTRGGFTGKTVLVEATVKIDKDHGSSAFDNIKLV